MRLRLEVYYAAFHLHQVLNRWSGSKPYCLRISRRALLNHIFSNLVSKLTNTHTHTPLYTQGNQHISLDLFGAWGKDFVKPIILSTEPDKLLKALMLCLPSTRQWHFRGENPIHILNQGCWLLAIMFKTSKTDLPAAMQCHGEVLDALQSESLTAPSLIGGAHCIYGNVYHTRKRHVG